MNNLDRCCQLNEEIRIIYVVDGFCAQLWTEDDHPYMDDRLYMEANGPEILDALNALDTLLEGKELTDVRRVEPKG